MTFDYVCARRNEIDPKGPCHIYIYIYIKFEEFSRVLSYKKQCICIGYVHNFDDFLKFIHSVFYLLIPTCKAKSRFYLLTISFLIFYLLDPYYICICPLG